MLTHLLLMRHAKSSWAEENMSDHERPLNKRGDKAAVAVGHALIARGYAPDTIWSSDATRTRQTAIHLIRTIPGSQVVNYNSDFYHTSAEQVLMVCGKQVEPKGKLMLLGHNPGWAALHAYFTGQPVDYPTGACTILMRTNDDNGDWLDPASWRLVDFIKPRDLTA